MTNKDDNGALQNIEDRLQDERRILDDIIKAENKPAARRSMCDWYEDGDSNSKLFLNLEKERADKKWIQRLQNEVGKMLTNPKEIMQEEPNFYQKLYESSITMNDKGSQSALFNTDSPKIKDEEHKQLIERITEEEVWNGIKVSPKNKSPGKDGSLLNFT